MNDSQWITHATPATERERVALELLRSELPDFAPYKAWVGFEFLTRDNAAFQVSALVMTQAGIFLLELFTGRGHLDVGVDTWLHTDTSDAIRSLDSPLLLARLKASRLHEVLSELIPDQYRIPPIQPLVFLTETALSAHIDHQAQLGLFGRPESEAFPSILDALMRGEGPGVQRASKPLNATVLARLEEAIAEAEFASSTSAQRFGDYRLFELLDTTELYQDYRAVHLGNDQTFRARVFRSGTRDPQAQERLRTAARREHQIVSELNHDHVLQVVQHIDDRERPALILDHHPSAQRLDHFLENHALNEDQRFALLRDIAEGVRYAHSKRVLHRALTPQCILVLPADADHDRPRPLIDNWHAARQDQLLTGTHHVADYLHERSQLYLAPEVASSSEVSTRADVYGLGTLAFALFAGEPPARSMSDLVDTLLTQGGLRLSQRTDKVPEALDRLIFDATRANPSKRLSSVDAFLEQLEQLHKKWGASERRAASDPLEARPGDRLDERYTLIKRLGSGATATALLASDGNDEVALKILHSEDHADRLRAEAEALQSFDHRRVVKLIEQTRIGGRSTLVLQYAGETLRQTLLDERSLSLGDLQRLGSDLLEIGVELEDRHVFHRDIKPANLGCINRRLMIFDFSLAGVAIDKVTVGTAAYRDPFLMQRQVWDTYADRYAAGLVLYEMVTQSLPVWGDGQSSPAVDAEANLQLDSERFPAAIRDDLVHFFERAFHRDIKKRFDNAREMATRWQQLFERTLTSNHDANDESLRNARPDSLLTGFGLSDVALELLDSLDVATVAQLLETSFQTLRFASGVPDAIRREVIELREQLEQVVSAPTRTTASGDDYASMSIDALLEYITTSKSKIPAEERALSDLWLAPESSADALRWADLNELARRAERPREEVARLVSSLRERWARKVSLNPLRDDIVSHIENAGGALGVRTLTRLLLNARGSTRKGDARIAAAAALARAAVEAELIAERPRLRIRRVHDEVFIATNPALLELLPGFGALADRFASEEPLATPERVYTDAQELFRSAGIDPLSMYQTLKLATAASQNAALSQRNEIYPRQMDALRALKLTVSLIVRRVPLRAEAIVELVQTRYPEAEALPTSTDAMEELLQDVDSRLRFDPHLFDGAGGFTLRGLDHHGPRLSRSTQAPALFVASSSYLSEHKAEEELRRIDERLDYRQRAGHFLAITVQPTLLEQAAQRLASTYQLERISLEELMITTMRACAEREGIRWQNILNVDRPQATPIDRSRLVTFLKKFVFPELLQTLRAKRGRLLLEHPGLFARYNELAHTMGILETMRDDLLHQRGAELIWMLLPGDAQRARPFIDHLPLPITSDAETLRLRARWIERDPQPSPPERQPV